ncbi:MAG: hypothetical protein CL840_01610 [Crocinitomicaceae bacterium]|nr:hypothetical protein [Crocinitomicaceae bacterium]
MATKIGIWIDKRSAKIISAENGGELMKTVKSKVEEYHPKGGSGTKMKGGPQDVVQDGKFLERETHQLKAYFNEVITSLPVVESLVIFGPSQTGQKLSSELSNHHKDLYGKLKGVETADSQTNNQLIAWVRDYFK